MSNQQRSLPSRFSTTLRDGFGHSQSNGSHHDIIMSSVRTQTTNTPQLSCVLCRDRKVRCDKETPSCSNCQRAGVECIPVYRKRLPRGRHASNTTATASKVTAVRRVPNSIDSTTSRDRGNRSKKTGNKDDLRERINRLESLISEVLPNEKESSTNLFLEDRETIMDVVNPVRLENDSKDSSTTGGQSTEAAGNPITQHFWNDLLEEVQGLQGLVNQPPPLQDVDDEDDKPTGPSTPQPSLSYQTKSSPISPLGFNRHLSSGSHAFSTSRTLAFRPPPDLATLLGQVYFQHVDPIIRVFHRPSLKAHILDGQPYLRYRPGHPAVEAVDMAVYYAAIGSMTVEQFKATFDTERADVLTEYRAACEAALDRAELLTTNDMTVLQAFIIYLVATRTCDKSRAVWTLVALAVRIAQALYLNSDDYRPSESVFEREMRRRLWYTICMLDLQSSFSQGSKPIITSSQTDVPSNVDDSDFDIDSEGDLPERSRLTDMTFALVAYHAQMSARQLHFATSTATDLDPQTQPKSRSLQTSFDWSERESIANAFETSATQLLQYCDPSESEYAWFTKQSAETFIAGMKIGAIRPFQRIGQGAPPRVQGNSYLLELAIKTLDNKDRLYNDPAYHRFQWYVSPQWQSIALAMTECYISTDRELVRKAWPLIESVFHHDMLKSGTSTSTGNKSTKLAGPLLKLLDRTRERVHTLLSTPEESSDEGRNASLDMPGIACASGVINLTNDRASSPSLSLQHWQSNDFPTDGMDELTRTMVSDPSWAMWEDFVNGLPLEEEPAPLFPSLASLDM